jgi:pSer/pThr/pTyr-binding forkhead associated (FHA) protein
MDEAKAYSVGRAADADLVLDHASISRRHVVLELKRDGELTILDPGSSHGTKLNGGKVCSPLSLPPGMAAA